MPPGERVGVWAETLFLGALGLVGGCFSYTSPVVAPPLDIRPPPAAELERRGVWPDDEVWIDPAFRQALVELGVILDRLETRGDQSGSLRLAFVRLGQAIQAVPGARARLDIHHAAEQLQRDDVWIDLAARFESWRAAADFELGIASAALSDLADGPYRNSLEVGQAARVLAESIEASDTDERSPSDDVQIVAGLRSAERVLQTIYVALARGG